MLQETTIVDRGRGPQLSNSRITVQDLVPYFQRHCTYDEILEIIPSLSVEAIQLIERYVQEHYDEVMEQDRRILERRANRNNSPEVDAALLRGAEKMAVLREEFKKHPHAERNGDHASG